MTHDLMDDHLEVCDKMPVPCPRNCGEDLLRGDLQEHKKACLNMVVKCPFYEAGCTEELLRKELDCHIKTSSNAHLLTLMASYSTLRAAHGTMEAKYATLETDYSQSKAECSKTKQEFEEMKSQAAVAIERINEDIPDQRLSKPLMSLVSALNIRQLNCAGDSVMFAISSVREENSWYSPPFCIHPGYKFSIELFYEFEHSYTELWLMGSDKDCDLEWPPDINYDI